MDGLSAQGSVLVPVLLTGLLACFLGYRLFKFLLGVAGFVTGAIVAGSLAWSLLSPPQIIVVMVGIAGGIAGAFLFVVFYYLGVFMSGAWLGVLLASLLAPAIGIEPLLIFAVLAIALGLLALLLQKYVIVTATALIGAWLIVSAAGSYLLDTPAIRPGSGMLPSLGGFDIWSLLAWIGLGILGMVVQLRSASRPEGRPKKTG